MSDVPVVFTHRLTRDQIAEIVGQNPRAIAAFERMFSDVIVTLPDAIGAVSEQESSVVTQDTFGRRLLLPLSSTAPEDDMQRVLAGQIFGA